MISATAWTAVVNRACPTMPNGPGCASFDLASFPILILGVSSDLDPILLRNIIDNQVKNRIERIPGVASLDIRGGLDREIQVHLDGEKIKALGLPLNQLLNRLKDENLNLPAGTIEQGLLDVTIRTPGIIYTNLDELKNTVVAIREGVPIQLHEIASVDDAWAKVTRVVRVNGKPGVRMSVSKQSGKNTVEVAQGVLKEIERINQDIPQLHITSIIDTSQYIERSITNLGASILYGGALAILVLLLFFAQFAQHRHHRHHHSDLGGGHLRPDVFQRVYGQPDDPGRPGPGGGHAGGQRHRGLGEHLPHA